MRKILPFYFIFVLFFILIAQNVSAENVHFNDYIYKLKSVVTKNTIIENEYFTQNENKDFWTSTIGIFYYPEESNPIKFAQELDKKIEGHENLLLLKFVQNKKQNIAVISYLENIIQSEKTYFIYNICKYEKHTKKGTVILKFSKKYVFNTKEDITKMANEIKSINDDYIEQMIILTVPQIVEKELP